MVHLDEFHKLYRFAGMVIGIYDLIFICFRRPYGILGSPIERESVTDRIADSFGCLIWGVFVGVFTHPIRCFIRKHADDTVHLLRFGNTERGKVRFYQRNQPFLRALSKSGIKSMELFIGNHLCDSTVHD